MPKAIHDLAKKLQSQGKSEDSSWAIATAALKEAGTSNDKQDKVWLPTTGALDIVDVLSLGYVPATKYPSATQAHVQGDPYHNTSPPYTYPEVSEQAHGKCGQCRYYVEGGSCALVKGAIDPINGTCKFWEGGTPLEIGTAVFPVYEQPEANYWEEPYEPHLSETFPFLDKKILREGGEGSGRRALARAADFVSKQAPHVVGRSIDVLSALGFTELDIEEAWVESEHPRDPDGQFASKDKITSSSIRKDFNTVNDSFDKLRNKIYDDYLADNNPSPDIGGRMGIGFKTSDFIRATFSNYNIAPFSDDIEGVKKLWADFAAKDPDIKKGWEQLNKDVDEFNEFTKRAFKESPSFFRGTSTRELNSYLEHGNMSSGRDVTNYDFVAMSPLKNQAQIYSEGVIIEYEGNDVREHGEPVEYDLFFTDLNHRTEKQGGKMNAFYMDQLEVRVDKDVPLTQMKIKNIYLSSKHKNKKEQYSRLGNVIVRGEKIKETVATDEDVEVATRLWEKYGGSSKSLDSLTLNLMRWLDWDYERAHTSLMKFHNIQEAFDEGKHPRHGAGSEEGGRFAKGDGSQGAPKEQGQQISQRTEQVLLPPNPTEQKREYYESQYAKFAAFDETQPAGQPEPIHLTPQPDEHHMATAYRLLKKYPDMNEQEIIHQAWRADQIRKQHEPILADMKQTLSQAMPSYQVSGRIKARYSAIEKLGRKSHYKDVSELGDMSAVRVIAPTLQDTATANQFIRDNYALKKDDDFVATPNEGYRAHHFDIDNPDGTRSEMQVKTPNQDHWSEFMHDRLYKVDENSPEYGELKAHETEMKMYAAQMSEYYYQIDLGNAVAQEPDCPPRIRRLLQGCL